MYEPHVCDSELVYPQLYQQYDSLKFKLIRMKKIESFSLQKLIRAIS